MTFRNIAAGTVLGTMLALSAPVTAAAEEKPAYLKAATYASDAWVINFWNTESDHMDEELARIAADGFNGIILVVPWREFQPQTSPVVYNSYAFQKFYRVMQAAEEHGLWVQLRVGYTWDFYTNEEGSTTRFRELVEKPSQRRAWLAYVGQLYQTASRYSNFYGGFITWEDYWEFLENGPVFGTKDGGAAEAERIGFQSFLKERYSLGELTELFSPEMPFTSYSQVYMPSKDSRAYRLLYEFYDDWMNELLRDAQQVFPDLSMEIRLDVDLVDGGAERVSHASTFGCGDSSYTSLMYSVSMGHGYGQELGAGTAAATLSEKLDEVRSHNGGKPVFIDQLLYMDVTEGFENNARLAAGERAPFLTAIPQVLAGRTNGYGIWTYRNYANNALYNCQFALGSRGWDTANARVEERNGSRQMRIEDGGSAAQKFGGRLSGKGSHDNHVRFTAESDAPAAVAVSIGTVSQTVEVDGSGQYDLNFSNVQSGTVSFEAQGGAVYIDNVQVYNFVQDGQLYDLDGGELSCIGAMRALNGAMN